MALAGSPFAKVPPVKMAFIPGVTRTPNQSDVVMSFRKTKDRKKEKEKEKKTCKFYCSGARNPWILMYNVCYV